jgi:alkanesulfonate monooxygenase SsuD/methylene tetrahydromethanopterin reductase-like flavin-dependent oxidoreductase (luciferase family)
MAALAGATERVKFGMNAMVASLRDPLVAAKQCATIDFLSGGRLLPVFVPGHDDAPEWRATGRDARERGRLADEILEIMRRLWSEESVTFEGRHFRYADVSIAPRPVQQPLPLWIGGHSPAAVRRTARVGTGYLAGLAPPAQVAGVLAAIRRELAAAGRTIDPDHYGVTLPYRFGSFDDPPVQRIAAARAAAIGDARSWLAVGDAAAIRRALQAYVDVGVSKFVMIPLARGEEDLVLQTRRLVDETIPSFEASATPRAAAAG